MVTFVSYLSLHTFQHFVDVSFVHRVRCILVLLLTVAWFRCLGSKTECYSSDGEKKTNVIRVRSSDERHMIRPSPTVFFSLRRYCSVVCYRAAVFLTESLEQTILTSQENPVNTIAWVMSDPPYSKR